MADEIKKSKGIVDLVTSLPSNILIPSMILLGIAFYYIYVAKIFTLKQLSYFIIFILVLVFIIAANRRKQEPKRFTSEECEKKALEILKNRQLRDQFPSGEIKMGGPVGSHETDKEVDRYEFQFLLTNEEIGVAQEWSIRMDPSINDMTDILPQPAGFDGRNTRKTRLYPRFFDAYGLKKKEDD